MMYICVKAVFSLRTFSESQIYCKSLGLALQTSNWTTCTKANASNVNSTESAPNFSGQVSVPAPHSQARSQPAFAITVLTNQMGSKMLNTHTILRNDKNSASSLPAQRFYDGGFLGNLAYMDFILLHKTSARADQAKPITQSPYSH